MLDKAEFIHLSLQLEGSVTLQRGALKSSTWPPVLHASWFLAVAMLQACAIHVMVVTWPWGICLICMPEAQGLRVARAEGIHIRQITNGHVTIIMYHFVPIVTTPVV